MARSLVQQGELCEVFVDAPLGVAEQRDPKGLDKGARAYLTSACSQGESMPVKFGSSPRRRKKPPK